MCRCVAQAQAANGGTDLTVLEQSMREQVVRAPQSLGDVVSGASHGTLANGRAFLSPRKIGKHALNAATASGVWEA
jgi:hypothetical protein